MPAVSLLPAQRRPSDPPRKRVKKQAPDDPEDERAKRAIELMERDPATRIGDASKLCRVTVAQIEAALKRMDHDA